MNPTRPLLNFAPAPATRDPQPVRRYPNTPAGRRQAMLAANRRAAGMGC